MENWLTFLKLGFVQIKKKNTFFITSIEIKLHTEVTNRYRRLQSFSLTKVALDKKKLSLGTRVLLRQVQMT